MLRGLYHSTSFKNLSRARPSGQIATLLILLMVIMLIFVLVTMNVGKVSLQTTTLANAADAAGLSLASQLGTKAQQLFKALGTGKIENCTRVNWLTMIFAIIIAIILIIITFGGAAAGLPALFAACSANLGTMAITIGVGALGGAIGGTIGAAAGGTSIEKGAAQGAAIGMAVGAAFVAAGSMITVTTPGASATGAQSATVVTESGAVATGTCTEVTAVGSAATVLTAQGTYVTGTVVSLFVNSLLNAAIGGAVVGISAGSELYGYNREVEATEDFYSELQKQFGSMNEYDRYREGTFYLALSQVVDDPRKTSYDPDKQVDCDNDGKIDLGDEEFDTDGNGDLKQEIPCFQYWWYKRIQELKMDYVKVKELVRVFFEETMKDFADFAETQIFNGGALDRAAYKHAGDTAHADGVLVQWAEALEEKNASLFPGNTNTNVTFWKSGDADDIIGPTENYNGTEWNEFYYDEIDALVKELAGIVGLSKGLYGQMNVEQLANNWEDWIEIFHDKNAASRGDFYDEIWLMVKGSDDFAGLDAWIKEIKDIRKSLPSCLTGSCANPLNEVCNPACRLPDEPGAVPGSVDYDQEDEFTPVVKALEELREKIVDFRKDLAQFRQDMDKYTNQKGDVEKYGGLNPVTYTWSDKLGEHSVSVEITNFLARDIPRIKKYKKNESWGGLVKDVCSGIVPPYGTPTVTVSRYDADIGRPIGFLGKWNPFGGRIKRTCKAFWHWDGIRYLVDMFDIK